MPTAMEEPVHVEVNGGRVLLSRSPTVRRLWELIQRVAPADVSVLITGETGTGKELVARLLHKLSARAPNEFIAVDCNAVAPALLESELFGHERGAFTGADRQRAGMFELADGTTLFLDEISNLPREAQTKLLRVLQEREFRRLGGRSLVRTDFRLISASNVDLSACVRAGAFREDLFHRLKVINLHLPPLRERREDIPILLSHFINQKRLRLKRPNVCRVSNEAVDLLVSYDWPGNVRELENVVETAMIECPGDTIDVTHLIFGAASGAQGPAREELDLVFRVARRHALATFERLYLLAQLRRHKGSIKNASFYAGITTKHMRALMKRHGINRRDFRPPLRPRSAPSSSSVAAGHEERVAKGG